MRIPQERTRCVATCNFSASVRLALIKLQADIALLRLPAPNLRGTFAKAYSLLTLLVSKIGWDELLKIRSSVFVMEEEYRLHKTNVSVDMNGEAADGASVAGLKRNSSEGVNTPSDIPTIRISSESMRTPNTASGPGFGEKTSTRKPALEKPETAQANEDPNSPLGMKSEGEQPVSAFSHKRLCERWLGVYSFSRLSRCWLTSFSR